MLQLISPATIAHIFMARFLLLIPVRKPAEFAY
jgi:hypothetical protein